MPDVKEDITPDTYHIYYIDNTAEIKLSNSGNGDYHITRFSIDEEGKKDIGQKLFDYIKANGLTIMSDDNEKHAEHNRFLNDIGLQIAYSKFLFEKNLTEPLQRSSGNIEVHSIQDTGLEYFLSVFDRVTANDPERTTDQTTYFKMMKDFADTAYNPENWYTASVNGRDIGLIMPQVYHDAPKLGSIFYIGVLPEEKKKGFGQQLHLLGLHKLRDRGATRYVGSTDTQNIAMLRLFEVNECKKIKERYFFKA